MNGPDNIADRIVQENDSTVGGKYHQRQIRCVGDQCICRVIPGGKQTFSCIVIGADANGSIVDLFAEDCPLYRQIDHMKEATIIFQNGRRLVAAADTQIQRIPGRERNASLTG